MSLINADNNKAEQALRLLNASASAVLEVDRAGAILFASDTVEKLFGYKADELLGTSIEVLIPVAKREGHEAYFAEFLKQPVSRSMGSGRSFPGLHKQGHEVNVSIGLSVIDTAQPNPSGDHNNKSIVVTITESNLLNRMESTLRDREREASLSQDENARLLAMVHHSQNAILLVDTALRIHWVNSAMAKIFGYEEHEVLGEHPLFCVDQQNNSEEVLVLHKALESRLVYSGQLKLKPKASDSLWVDLQVFPNFEDERFLGFVFHINNVDEQVRLINEVSNQKSTLESTAKIAHLGTWELDLKTNDLVWSAEVYNIHEIEPGTEIDVANAINYYAPEARPTISAAIEKCMADGEQWDLELPFITAKNNAIWVRAVGYAEFDDGQPVRLKGAFQDITQLKNAVEASTAASKAKSLFLANISHEIRTPINGVLGMNDLLLSSGLNAQQTEYANIVKSSAETLLQLINELLDFSKLEAGKLKILACEFDLKEMLTEKLQWHVHSAFRKALKFDVDISPEVPALICADDNRLGQVVNNLCSNAIKFTHHGGIEFRVELIADNLLKFSIQDSGIGVKEEQLQSIFNEFEQVDNSSTRQYSGTGLGLSISAQLVELMGGEISASSIEGEGSLFSFTLPFDSVTERAKVNSVELSPTLFVSSDTATSDVLATLSVKRTLDYSVCRSTSAALKQLKDSKRWQNIVVVGKDIDNASLLNSSIARLARSNASIMWLCSKYDEAASNPQISLLQPILSNDLARMSPREQTAAFEDMLQAIQLIESESLNQSKRRLLGSRILIVEDNSINQTVFTEMLKGYNVDITLAENGAEAVTRIEHGELFDVILMDCQMPIMDGYEATKRIRNMPSSEASSHLIVAATAHGLEEDLNACLAAGMNDYLVKPFTQEQLVSALLRNLS
ncbi:PAS domain S-box protein [Glaciecola sp. MH2013]|uniref:PAS domain-containing hybrid sensor histidine kinase/response regulator n=1 Tax=Glaciecola sp. MH2013 TaxID=2785524 RepID=UPI00189DABAA|nr:PAS domain S-box protein [Glaciecola sp. MH2013]MBF7073732.1 PAS domain S-box protein [Glaciecola sp. MH2013]